MCVVVLSDPSTRDAERVGIDLNKPTFSEAEDLSYVKGTVVKRDRLNAIILWTDLNF